MITIRSISQLQTAKDTDNLSGYYTPCYNANNFSNERIPARYWSDKLATLNALLRKGIQV